MFGKKKTAVTEQFDGSLLIGESGAFIMPKRKEKKWKRCRQNLIEL